MFSPPRCLASGEHGTCTDVCTGQAAAAPPSSFPRYLFFITTSYVLYPPFFSCVAAPSGYRYRYLPPFCQGDGSGKRVKNGAAGVKEDGGEGLTVAKQAWAWRYVNVEKKTLLVWSRRGGQLLRSISLKDVEGLTVIPDPVGVMPTRANR